MNKKVRLTLIFVGGFFLIADRILKFLSISYFIKPSTSNSLIGWLPSHNYGVAFGIPLPNVFIVFLSLIFITVLSWLYKKNIDLLARFGIFFMIIGALSNLTDRIIYGYTLDYFLLYLSIFNLADILIVSGAICCLVAISKNGYSEAQKQI